jgi:hypothetical protein
MQPFSRHAGQLHVVPRCAMKNAAMQSVGFALRSLFALLSLAIALGVPLGSALLACHGFAHRETCDVDADGLGDIDGDDGVDDREDDLDAMNSSHAESIGSTTMWVAVARPSLAASVCFDQYVPALDPPPPRG